MKITLFPGDGIGPEIVTATVKVMDAAAKKFGFALEYDHQLLGGCAIDAYNDPYPEVTQKSAKAADAVLLGAVGGPKWDNVDPSIRPEKGLLRIRKDLGLYCNLRPMKVSKFTAHLSPLKPERAANTDLLIVRELTGGIYFGTHNEAAMVDGVETASDVDLYTRPEVERIARKAFEAAKVRRGKVTSVDKANVLAESRMWRKIVTEMQAKEYPEIELNHLYVDNCAMQLVLNPGQFDVVLTNNIFGDILSDEASVLGGPSVSYPAPAWATALVSMSPSTAARRILRGRVSPIPRAPSFPQLCCSVILWTSRQPRTRWRPPLTKYMKRVTARRTCLAKA